MPFFTLKYLIRYTSKMFFEEMNFKNFCYLRRCGVITVQSLGSRICPQPSRLGLTVMAKHGSFSHLIKVLLYGIGGGGYDS
jgi:hypothetical protein